MIEVQRVLQPTQIFAHTDMHGRLVMQESEALQSMRHTCLEVADQTASFYTHKLVQPPNVAKHITEKEGALMKLQHASAVNGRDVCSR